MNTPTGLRAPRPAADRVLALRAEPPAASHRSAHRPTGAPCNDAEPPLRTPYGDVCRKRDAIQAVKDRYWSLKNRLAARMEREIRRLERNA